MNRCRDYCGFVIWFAGIGYAALWPLTANGASGHPFGASVVCGDGSRGLLAPLCHLQHPFTLPVGLHLLGFAAAILLAVRLFRRLMRHLRPRASIVPTAALAVRLPGAIPARPRPPAPRLRQVKPRKHFGLRGLSR